MTVEWDLPPVLYNCKLTIDYNSLKNPKIQMLQWSLSIGHHQWKYKQFKCKINVLTNGMVATESHKHIRLIKFNWMDHKFYEN